MKSSRTATVILLVIAVLSIGIGIFWTVRTAPPSPRPWWAGKDPVIRVEIWEPGKDIATVAMRMPKGMFDTMIAFGLPARISINDEHHIDVNKIWKDLQRLPRGQKLKFEQDGGTIYIWIDSKTNPSI